MQKAGVQSVFSKNIVENMKGNKSKASGVSREGIIRRRIVQGELEADEKMANVEKNLIK